ncbi:MAG TPA: DUF4149 domain-containing protein [Dehalococcoidia bacterium]|nr:DUF4149 domain-containing protein [Dehalococcoidia bacterium]
MLEALPYWLHLIAAAAWVGPQLMMFLVVVPGLGALDTGTRARFLARISVRFGWLGAASLALLLLTGIDNIDRYAPGRMFEFRYGYILAVKLALFGIVTVLTALHSLVVGPRLLRLQELAAHSPDSAPGLPRARRASALLSALTLVLSLAVLFCAALLRSRWAFGPA